MDRLRTAPPASRDAVRIREGGEAGISAGVIPVWRSAGVLCGEREFIIQSEAYGAQVRI
jgi:hypothetical protein